MAGTSTSFFQWYLLTTQKSFDEFYSLNHYYFPIIIVLEAVNFHNV